MRKSFTWFLSLMVLLVAFATSGFAQEAQKTVELYAEEASDCYNEADDYTVKISVRDFIKLNRFELELEFNENIFEFKGATGVIPSLSTVTIAETGGVISLNWSGSVTTIGDNVKTDILTLHFAVLGYPGNTVTSFSSSMVWNKSDFWYTANSEEKVNTDISTNGSLSVTVPNALTFIETAVTTETCAGGDVTLSVTAPDAAYYLFNEDPNPANWTGAWSTSPDYDVKAGDEVTVRVKDGNGCISLRKVVMIPETIEPVTFTVETQNPACYGGKGSVIFDANGGIAPYTYYISENSDGSDAVTYNNFQFNTKPGTYYVAVQDANGCANLEDLAYWQEITITDNNTEVVITAVPTPVLCYGGNTGTIAVSVAGDANMVSINDGMTWKTLVEGGYTFTGLTAGTYKVWAKNDAGCMVSLSDIVVSQPVAPITFDIIITDTSCGGDDDGSIEVVNVDGGTAPYEYSIDGGVSWLSDPLIAGLEPTYYSLWVRDANGCIKAYSNPNGTGNTIAVQSPEDIQYVVNITNPLCNNEDATVSITNVTGGSGSYIYSFDAGATWGSVKTISWPYPYAEAIIWVANADSTCPVQQVINEEDVYNPAILDVTVDAVFAPTCIDGTDGNIHLLITGGVKPYSYSINGSSWKTSNNNLTIIKATVGTHSIRVKDANGCEYDNEIEVTVELEENIISATSDGNIDCFGDKAGTISLFFTDWAEGLNDDDEPYRGIQFYVQNEAGNVSSFMPSNHGGTATTFNAGTYIVWVVDQYTCESNTDTVVITQNPELLITDVVANGASCFGSFEGTITVHATGGNVDGLLEYAIVNNEGALGNIEENKWLPFETYNSITKLSTVSFKVEGGTYWIAVRDNGCDEVTYGPIEVDGYSQLLVNENLITSTEPLCYESADGTITVPMNSVSGGAGSYLFTLLKWVIQGEEVGNWVPVTGKIDQATGEFTGLTAGTYAVLVEDAEDCPSYTTEPIILDDPYELEISIDYWHFSCEGTNDGIITVYVTGGTPGYWYAINNPNTWVEFAKDATSKTYIATEPGTFVVWVKDANGCITAPDTVTILEPTALSAEIEIDNVSCNGGSNGEISIEGIGGWEGMTTYEFKINNGSWTSATTISGLPAGNHTLYIKDVNSYSMPYQALDCVYSKPFTITQPGKITYDVVIDDVSCKDGADGIVTVNVLSGGTPWVINNSIDDEGYDIRITGDAYDSGWNRTGADFSYSFTGLAHSHYTVYITDSKGCVLDATIGDSESPYTTIESWEVQEPDTYLMLNTMWIKDALCYGSEDGQFKAMASGGTAPYKYFAGLSIPPDGGDHLLVEAPAEDSELWQESDTFNVGAGTWVVWTMDVNGCIVGGEFDKNGVPVNEWRVKVEQPDSVMWDWTWISGDPDYKLYVRPSCFGESDGQIPLTVVSGGSGVYNAHVRGISAAGAPVNIMYTDIEEDDFVLTGVPASNEDGFSVTVMDDNGCESMVDTIFISQPAPLTVTLQESPDNYSCFGAVEGWIEAYAEGGNEDIPGMVREYQLLKNGVVHTPWQSIASAFLVEVGNKFVVQVRDIVTGRQTCTTESDTLDMPTPLKVEFTYEDLTCADDTKAVVKFNVTGTPGRQFRVWYREVEQDVPSSTVSVPYNGWFNESIVVEGVFIFDNENFDDHHYEIVVEDDHGCLSVIDTLTFDQVQTAVALNVTTVETNECTQVVDIAFNGGVQPYVVMLNDTVTTETTLSLERGSHVIKVMDSHMCVAEQTVNVVGIYVTRDTTINTYIAEETAFVDVEAGVDTMLAVGSYKWVYTLDCERTLNVTVVEIPRPYTIAEVQGEGIASPLTGKIAQITGTVTGVAEGEGFFVQDANAAWSGIWVEYSGVNDKGIKVGDGITVVGEVSEVADVTTILATDVMTATETPVITAIEITPTDAKAEKYESVVVHVPGARASAADAGSGEWTIYYLPTDNVIVNDWLYEFIPVVDAYYNVTGIVNGRLDAFKLEPRMESDVVSVPTKVDPELANTFKVYPNPFNDRILLDNNNKVTRVVINNIAGQRVIDIEYPNREIRTANLVSGIYVISIYTENGIAKTERMIKR